MNKGEKKNAKKSKTDKKEKDKEKDKSENKSEKKEKKHKQKKEKKEGEPKKPQTAYFLFCADKRKENKDKKWSAKELGDLFKGLSEEEKNKYKKAHEDLMKEYEKEIKKNKKIIQMMQMKRIIRKKLASHQRLNKRKVLRRLAIVANVMIAKKTSVKVVMKMRMKNQVRYKY